MSDSGISVAEIFKRSGIFKPDSSFDDDIAYDEASKLENETDLEKASKRNEHNRTQTFKNHFHCLSICFLWAGCGAIILAAGSWLWHWLSPECLHYLTDRQISKIETILGSAVISSVVTKYVQKRTE